MAQKLIFVHALTPLHAGAGQGVGAIDLPIQRERATNLPVLPGSGLKGCLRDAMRADQHVDLLFGAPSKEGEDMSAGVLRISDAHLLLLPVRCLGATFAWTTCPFVLRRFARAAGATAPSVPAVADGNARLASMDATVKLSAGSRLVLEDLDFDPGANADPDAIAWCKWIGDRLFPKDGDPWREELRKRFAIVDDKSFDFLSEFATEVTAHISINDETGTVDEGALWYQEALPAETVLAGVLQADTPRKGGSGFSAEKILEMVVANEGMQFGGKASTGLGYARLMPARA